MLAKRFITRILRTKSKVAYLILLTQLMVVLSDLDPLVTKVFYSVTHHCYSMVN